MSKFTEEMKQFAESPLKMGVAFGPMGLAAAEAAQTGAKLHEEFHASTVGKVFEQGLTTGMFGPLASPEVRKELSKDIKDGAHKIEDWWKKANDRAVHSGFPDIELLDESQDVKNVGAKFDQINKSKSGKVMPAEIDEYEKNNPKMDKFEKQALDMIKEKFPNGCTKEDIDKMSKDMEKRSAWLL